MFRTTAAAVAEAARKQAGLEAWWARRAEERAAARVESFPASWADRLLKRWRERYRLEPIAANLQHLGDCETIAKAHRAGVRADAGDADIRTEADLLARDMPRRLGYVQKIAEAQQASDRLLMLGQYVEALHWLNLRGLADAFVAHARKSIPAALRRLGCARFWRGVLRTMHARAVETTARAIGLVNKRAGCYVSDDSLKRRQGQIQRNARVLESVHAVNEYGQDRTLAELAATGPANRAIRRMELMVRIAGFELIAKECGHAAYFVTVTCPSRMHAFRTKPGKVWEVEQNPNWDGVTNPRMAQEYLREQWRRFRSAADRMGLDLYGFRIAEPNHDGTPHWHALFFFPEKAGERPGYRVLVRLLRRYFLWNDSPEERGARRHRVALERIDWSRGTAAGYVAKYVAKNIDGYRVEKDLYGNDCLTASQRVDAWASTWRIRQFQQIGGAPVGVWRDLRRLHPEQAASCATVALALDAVNIAAKADAEEDQTHDMEEGRVTAAHGWATYLHLQGGHRVPRRLQRLHVLREQRDGLGRYGEQLPPRTVGVVTVEQRQLPRIGIVKGLRRALRVEVESERAIWRTCPHGKGPEQEAWKAAVWPGAGGRMRPPALASGEAARPWSPVNNCTRDPAPLFGPSVERHAKRGRWHRWKQPESGDSTPRKAPDDPAAAIPPQ